MSDADLPATDRAALERLQRFGGAKLLRQMIALFLTAAPERIAAARAGTGADDARAVELALHSLKSSAAQLGAMRMQRLSERGETIARAGTLDGVPALVHELEEEHTRVRAWLTAAAEMEPDMSKIAVVEDNADNRLLLQAILDGLHEIVEYENGLEALAGLAASLPDLVLLDISLPGMDGNEILARIRGDSRMRDLPVIALTAHAMAGDREKYLAGGFDDYVTKPIVDETLLLGAIDRWLARARGTSR